MSHFETKQNSSVYGTQSVHCNHMSFTQPQVSEKKSLCLQHDTLQLTASKMQILTSPPDEPPTVLFKS